MDKEFFGLLLAVGFIIGAPIIITLIIVLPIKLISKTIKTSRDMWKAAQEDKSYNPSQKKKKLWDSLEN